MTPAKSLMAIVIVTFVLMACSRQDLQIDYDRYREVFSTDDPVATSFVSGREENDGVTMFFEFKMEETAYESFSEHLQARGYTAKERRDGHFGSWSVSNSSKDTVFGQSKPESFGHTYFYFEPSKNKLTAIARFTSGR